MFKNITEKIVSKLLTQAFVEKLAVFLLETLAKRSDNAVDDEVVKMVKEALEA